MNKDDLNSKLREFASNKITPSESERNLVSSIYASFYKLFEQNCIQIGSFPRFTAIRPLDDLDILYILGNWDENSHNPYEILKILQIKINNKYENPTKYVFETSLQTHSITVLFKNGKEEVFSVDIVPGYKLSKNEFNQDTYMVPEITSIHHGILRTEYYQRLTLNKKEMGWIASDPRGYIEVAKRINQTNNDFRKTVKIIKAWKNSCEEKDKNFKLKSFHLEQIVTQAYINNPNLDIFTAIFNFFVDLPENITHPKIKDRADNSKFIDEYLNELSTGQKEQIVKARDCFLIKLEEISDTDPMEKLVDACFYTRASNSEKFLFDYKIPVLTDLKYTFEIYGEVQERDGFRKNILGKEGIIRIDRKIKFRIKGNPPIVDLFKWKVKNDNSSPQPRGEITDHRTRNDPELTKYRGNHFVECYAIKENNCVAKAIQKVKLDYPN